MYNIRTEYSGPFSIRTTVKTVNYHIVVGRTVVYELNNRVNGFGHQDDMIILKNGYEKKNIILQL